MRIYVGQRKLLAKTCKDCGEFKEASQFPTTTVRGKPYAHSSCRRCHTNRANLSTKRKSSESLAHAVQLGVEWSPADVDELRRLDELGLSSMEIAKRLGRSLSGIYGARYKFKEN